MSRAKQRDWTTEEETYLTEWYGKKSIKEIAKRLKREEGGVQRKIERMGLSKTTEYAGLITAYKFAELINVDSHTVLRWMVKRNMPHERKILAYEKEHILIDVIQFWKWAKENQSLINFSKIEKNVLIPEPDWIDEARRKDYHSIPKRTQQIWTDEEDQKIWYLYYKMGYTQEKVGEEVGRSRRGVQKRLSELRKKALITV